MKSILTTTLVLIAVNFLQAEQYIPSDVQRIINIRETETRKIDEQYCAALEKLKVRYTQKGELDHALLIDKLIKDAEKSLTGKSLTADFSGVWLRSDGDKTILHLDGKVSANWSEIPRTWRQISDKSIEIRLKNESHIWKLDSDGKTLRYMGDQKQFMTRIK